jgi:hypothetical protein
MQRLNQAAAQERQKASGRQHRSPLATPSCNLWQGPGQAEACRGTVLVLLDCGGEPTPVGCGDPQDWPPTLVLGVSHEHARGRADLYAVPAVRIRVSGLSPISHACAILSSKCPV